MRNSSRAVLTGAERVLLISVAFKPDRVVHRKCPLIRESKREEADKKAGAT
jgi:hypothetical protein